MTRYLLAGGGTAGHVNPLLAVADRIRRREPDATILVLGTREGLESRLIPARGYRLETIERVPFPRRPDLSALRFPLRFHRAVGRTRKVIRDHGIDVVVGFGGYASAPAYLAARAERLPLVLHEANAMPGIANRLGSRLTRWVGVAFSNTGLPNARVVGMPLRVEIEDLRKADARPEAMRFFGLDPAKPTLLATGGSLGARRINATVAASVPTLVAAGWQVLHIIGPKSELVDTGLAGYRLVPYADRMELALAAADFAVSRAGASTVSELTALGIPAVYVPYPVGNGEQRVNAEGSVRSGGALLVEDARFIPEWVSTELVPLLRDRARIAEMAARTAAAGFLDGADRMVDLIGDAVAGATRSVN